MGDAGDYWRDHREYIRERREAAGKAADPTGWTVHTQWHWSRHLSDGSRVDYWPTRNKFQHRGRVMCGGVMGYIRNQEAKIAKGKSNEI